MAKGLKIMNALAEMVANGKGSKQKPVAKQMKAAQSPVDMSQDDDDNQASQDNSNPEMKLKPRFRSQPPKKKGF